MRSFPLLLAAASCGAPPPPPVEPVAYTRDHCPMTACVDHDDPTGCCQEVHADTPGRMLCRAQVDWPELVRGAEGCFAEHWEPTGAWWGRFIFDQRCGHLSGINIERLPGRPSTFGAFSISIWENCDGTSRWN